MSKCAFVPPTPKKPKPTQRRQFKLWMILCLRSAGAELDLDSPYGAIQKALQKFEPFKPEISSDSEKVDRDQLNLDKGIVGKQPNAAAEGAAT